MRGYVRHSDHIIETRQTAIMIENARRAAMRAEMLATRNRRTMRIAATIGAALWIAAACTIAATI